MGTVEERLQQVQTRKQRTIDGALTDEEVRSPRIEELNMANVFVRKFQSKVLVVLDQLQLDFDIDTAWFSSAAAAFSPSLGSAYNISTSPFHGYSI
ncbi:unnamed protein product [Dovyalis caffra]|uniref:Uncharacterized protein n=1 Tax=Dovyalis caffra TaxID=77055 RepID=A0AAV1QZR9_9ROSI|nr:unnamed protein product [Dovyalis caffra]